MFWNKRDEKLKDMAAFIKWVKNSGGDIAASYRFPAEAPKYADVRGMDERLSSLLRGRGIERLYSHQAEAFALAKLKENIAAATPTASGKTLCYALPVFDSVLRSGSRALCLFPTKALAGDQLAGLRDLSAGLGGAVRCFACDGDTPREERAEARERGHVVVTNPDMLNLGILPQHGRWRDFFASLDYIVLDEIHAYRGVFGSHIANLLARLLRICSYYGSKPSFICCSATIANPAEHARNLTGREFRLISQSGAPSFEKELVIYRPPEKFGAPGGAARDAAAAIASKALCSGISTIVFARSRLEVEMLLTGIRERLAKNGADPMSVTGYRAGYLPGERRAAERALREGEILGAVSTNALEAGVDIGALQLAVLCGYPGSAASARQQMGRAGRRGGLSAAVLVTGNSAADRFIAKNPDWFVQKESESANTDPGNPYVRAEHILCSAAELPYPKGEPFGGQNVDGILSYFAENKLLTERETGGRTTYSWNGALFPAGEISLRGAPNESWSIEAKRNGKKGKKIGTADTRTAHRLLYPGAVYMHNGAAYMTEKLDIHDMSCAVAPCGPEYFTKSESSVCVNVIEEEDRRGLFGVGRVALREVLCAYWKLDRRSGRITGHGNTEARTEPVLTAGCWVKAPERMLGEVGVIAAMRALAHVMKDAAPLMLMCAREDIRVIVRPNEPSLRAPAIFIADSAPGGAGLAEGAFRAGARLIGACMEVMTRCRCKKGCYECIGGAPQKADVKGAAVRLCRIILDSLDTEPPL